MIYVLQSFILNRQQFFLVTELLSLILLLLIVHDPLNPDQNNCLQIINIFWPNTRPLTIGCLDK